MGKCVHGSGVLMEGTGEQRAKGCRRACRSSVRENEIVSTSGRTKDGEPHQNTVCFSHQRGLVRHLDGLFYSLFIGMCEVCVRVCVHVPQRMCGGQGQLAGALLLCESQRWNASSSQAWQQALLPSEPSRQLWQDKNEQTNKK